MFRVLTRIGGAALVVFVIGAMINGAAHQPPDASTSQNNCTRVNIGGGKNGFGTECKDAAVAEFEHMAAFVIQSVGYPCDSIRNFTVWPSGFAHYVPGETEAEVAAKALDKVAIPPDVPSKGEHTFVRCTGASNLAFEIVNLKVVDAAKLNADGTLGSDVQPSPSAVTPPSDSAALETSSAASASNDIMGSRFGNTIISRNERAEWHLYFRADGSFAGKEVRSNYNVSGSWTLDNGELCLTFHPPLGGVPNPDCKAASAHRLGDSWTAATTTMSLVGGIQ